MQTDTDTAQRPAETPRRASLAQIPPDRVRAFAPKTLPLVLRACAYSGGRFDPETVYAACAYELDWLRMQMWVWGHTGGGQPASAEAVAITCLSTFGTGLKVLEIVLVAGQDAKGWLEFEDKLAAFALAEGCTRMQVIGRKGWGRNLPHWKESARMFERVIRPEGQEDEDDGQR